MRKTISCLVVLLLSTGCTLILDTDNTGKRCSDQGVTCEPGYFCNFDNDTCEKENGQNDGGLDGEDGADGSDGADQGPKPNGESCSQNQECASEYCGNGYCCWDFYSDTTTICCWPGVDCDYFLGCDPDGRYCYVDCKDGEADSDNRCIEGYHCDDGFCVEDAGGGSTCDEHSDCASGECINDWLCCEHAGLCCENNDDCPDMFAGCSAHPMFTCEIETFNLPDTGQTKCYTAENEVNCPNEGIDYHGQDAQYGDNTRAYSESNDTIIDSTTGLTWWKVSQTTTSWDDAFSICDSDATGGISSWRLPMRHELHTLVDYGVESGTIIDPIFVPAGTEMLFWTSTEVSGNSLLKWVVDFGSGYVKHSNKIAVDVLVRCVEQM